MVIFLKRDLGSSDHVLTTLTFARKVNLSYLFNLALEFSDDASNKMMIRIRDFISPSLHGNNSANLLAFVLIKLIFQEMIHQRFETFSNLSRHLIVETKLP